MIMTTLAAKTESPPQSAPSSPDTNIAAASPAVEMSESEAPSEKIVQEAEGLKNEGNAYFKASQWAKAVECYSKALDLVGGKSEVFLANRSFAYLKSESFGLARLDALNAIKINPKYTKAYYRLASAHMALGKMRQAVKVFKRVCKMRPNDKAARKKLKLCEAEVMREKFEAAIETEMGKPLSETFDVESIVVEDKYEGPRLEVNDSITEDFVLQLIAWLKDRKTLHRKYCAILLLRCIEYFKAQPTLMDIEFGEGEGKDAGEAEVFNVCGDTHGQYYDVLNIFEINGMPSSSNPYLFNGDFVDRGSFSVEVILTFFALKMLHKKAFFMTRGNHETKSMNRVYGFDGEVKHKYDETIMKLFSEAFCHLPLCAVINKKVFVVHGGLFSTDGVTLDDIRKVQRNREPPDSGLMSEMLWSDPQPFMGRGPSKRGVGLSFGPDITKAFLETNGLSMVVRSHEVKDEGYLLEHDGKLVTVFSAPNYCKYSFLELK